MTEEGEFDEFIRSLSESTMNFLLAGGEGTNLVLSQMMDGKNTNIVDEDGGHLATVGASYNGIAPPQIWLLMSDEAERSGDEDMLTTIIEVMMTFTSGVIELCNTAITVYPANDLIRRAIFNSMGFKEITSFHVSFEDAGVQTPKQIMAIFGFAEAINP